MFKQIYSTLQTWQVPEEQRGAWDKTVLLAGLLMIVAMPEIAWAAPWDGALQKIIDILTGTTARLLAIIAIIALGYMALTGRISWMVGGSIIFGLMLIFGAGWIADTMIGSVSA